MFSLWCCSTDQTLGLPAVHLPPAVSIEITGVNVRSKGSFMTCLQRVGTCNHKVDVLSVTFTQRRRLDKHTCRSFRTNHKSVGYFLLYAVRLAIKNMICFLKTLQITPLITPSVSYLYPLLTVKRLLSSLSCPCKVVPASIISKNVYGSFIFMLVEIKLLQMNFSILW